MNTSSKLLITMGDVAGVGPEIIAKAWPALNKICRPIVVGDPEWMKKAILLVNPSLDIETITDPGKASSNSNKISCLKIPTADLSDVAKCKISAKAGQAAHDFLINAIDLTLAGFADGIVTCPLHKEGLHLAGLDYPGHTEILATRTKAPEHVMILALPNLAVAHVTLHTALKNVFGELSTERIIARAELLETVAEVLAKRGCEGFVFRGDDGLDEVSLSTTTTVLIIKDGVIRREIFDPSEIGLEKFPLSALKGGTPDENAQITRGIFAGELGAYRESVLINAAASIAAFKGDFHLGIEQQFANGYVLAKQAVDSGGALHLVERWADLSNELAKSSL